MDESLFETHKRLSPWNARQERCPGPRTTMLIRCTTDEAARIRSAAKRRDTTISGFVLHTLRCSWVVAEGLNLPGYHERELQTGNTIRAVTVSGNVITGTVSSIRRYGGAVQFEVEHDDGEVDTIYSWQVVRDLT